MVADPIHAFTHIHNILGHVDVEETMPSQAIAARDTDLGACLGVEIEVYKGGIGIIMVKILFHTLVFVVQGLPHLERGSFIRGKGSPTVVVYIPQGREISIDFGGAFHLNTLQTALPDPAAIGCRLEFETRCHHKCECIGRG
jgi:hypothetical protein